MSATKPIQLFFVILILSFSININCFSQDTAKVKECLTYDELFTAINDGTAGYINKGAYIKDFSISEASRITVSPVSGEMPGYKVEIKILGLKKGPEDDTTVAFNISMLGFIIKDCTKFGDEYEKFNNSSCSFYTSSLDDVKEVVVKGITKSIDENYLIEGDLVDVYAKMCSKVKPPHVVKKPALYLYPEQTMNVKVNVTVNGTLTYTEPAYNNGWDVTATPDGMIDNKYDYLFYEADLKNLELPDEGWVVEYSNLEKWFDGNLPKLGLNTKEAKQFKEYWLKDLKQANYYEIKLLGNNFLNDNMKLAISPEPQTVIRLNFYFMPLNDRVNIKEPQTTAAERKGFTVVEWGGINGSKKLLP